ncbi:energy transducer TonB [Adhaeribacter swui]|uniref:Energy transducer TonB n=1 Tax=Adhaeribacter swui TaxID=2086471 RepID=A0A7G7GC47_9BACT|nr:energy transducer TonB [Adhaeribacter swui]QNF34731.1 energy transducer TonB [Adhaeribacter swui]
MSGSGPKQLAYSFPFKYSDQKCDSFNLNITDYFINNEAIGYKAPQISTGEKTFNQFIAKNIVYPGDAVRENIQGTVKLVFTITKDGNIENIYVQEGRHILLDKEAVRVVRKLKLLTPPIIKGQNQDLCVSMPVSFRLQ